MSKIFRFKGHKRSAILSVILAVIVTLGAVGIISLFKRVENLETVEKVSWTQYARGLLDDTTGKLPRDAEDIDYSGIHMKSFIKADGLKCEIADNGQIKYEINWFDEDYQFIQVDKFTTDYDGDNNPAGAVFALIEIKPLADADGIVSSGEVFEYARRLTVTYNK